MHRSLNLCRIVCVSLFALSLIPLSARAAEGDGAAPADSAFAKADSSWQRMLLSNLDGSSSDVRAGGQKVDNPEAIPASDIPAKFGPSPVRFTALAKGMETKCDYQITEGFGGQLKMLGMWVNLPDSPNVVKVGFQIVDGEGESFSYMTDADWTGWRWVEAAVSETTFQGADKAPKNGKIDFPVASVHIVWTPKKSGRTMLVTNELLAAIDTGDKKSGNVMVNGLGQLTLEATAPLHMNVTFNNPSDKDVPVIMEYRIQEDPQLYSKLAPLPKFGVNVAVGAHSWFEIDGRTYDIADAITDGKISTSYGGPLSKEGWDEGFAYIDLHQVYPVAHMGQRGGNASRMYMADYSYSLDGKNWTPIEGAQNVELRNKWVGREIDVAKPFEARYIRMRFHNGTQKAPVFALPGEFLIFSGENEDTWKFPDVGPALIESKVSPTVPARNFGVFDLGDGRKLAPGAYLVSVRTKIGDETRLNFGHILVPPAPPEHVTSASRFGMNGIANPVLGRKQGYGWVRFETLKWPLVSPAEGVYNFQQTQPLDALFKSFKDNDLTTLPYLFQTPRYAVPKGTKGAESTPPTDMSKFGEFAFQAVARYGSKKHPAEELLTEDKVSGLNYINTYELWNEADLNDPGWGSWRAKFEDYYILYRYGAEAVKKADPDAKVANGGWSGMTVPLMETMRNYKYPDGKCPLDFTDVLSVHYYSFQTPPELAMLNTNTNRSGSPLHGESFEHELAALVAWRDKVKPQMPVWMTETGYDTGGPKGTDERLQACWLPRDLMMILAAGIDKVFVYRETGSGSDLFTASGTTRSNGTLKPAWLTYATLIRQLDGVIERPTKMTFSDQNIRAYVWQRGEKKVITAWAITGTGKLDLPLGQCTVTDAFGQSKTATVDQPLSLTEFPLYITNFTDGVEQQLTAQVKKMADEQRARLERETNLHTYLYEFGGKDRNSTMTLGVTRTYTDVVAADTYSAEKGYGFVTKSGTDQNAKWMKPAFAVRVPVGAKFSIKAAPGNYELRFSARGPESGKVIIHGAKGGDQEIALPAAQKDEAVAAAQVTATDQPITVETGFTGEFVWLTLIEVEAGK